MDGKFNSVLGLRLS